MRFIYRCYAETEPGTFRQFSLQKFSDAKYGRIVLPKFADQQIRFITFEGWLDNTGRIREIRNIYQEDLSFDSSGAADSTQAVKQLWQVLERSNDYMAGQLTKAEFDSGPRLFDYIDEPKQVATIKSAVEEGKRVFQLSA